MCNHIYTNKKWCENKNENPWVIFELNDYYNIDKLVFRDVAPYESGNGNVPEYWVYISTTGTDDDDWTLVKYANDGATVDVKEIDLDGSVEARYIKFVASRGTRTDNGQKENAIRIYGFDIYGEYSRPVERENLVSVGKSVMYFYKSNNYYQYPLHLLDGNKSNPANKWCFDKPSTSDPVRILILDLEEEYDIEKFVLYDAGFLGDKADNMTGCKIHISTEAPDLNLISTYQDNNKCWEKVVDDSEGKDDSVKTYTLDTPKRGRYLKLEIPRGRVGDLTSIYQFEVYKKAGGSSISNQSIDSIEIYPNILQSGDSLHIESLSGGEMSIYDLKGLKLFSDEVKTSSYSKQINLPSGNYIVKVRTQYKEETVKLIIL
ncbi:discoidin domain-containing protein [Bacteroidales bacterium OttesenSCG-928-I14]|nr:discoidin domain-containing protein [Bacteroidales bacterium OttesenSCG-928-I14]